MKTGIKRSRVRTSVGDVYTAACPSGLSKIDYGREGRGPSWLATWRVPGGYQQNVTKRFPSRMHTERWIKKVCAAAPENVMKVVLGRRR